MDGLARSMQSTYTYVTEYWGVNESEQFFPVPVSVTELDWTERFLKRLQKIADYPEQWVKDNLEFAVGKDFFSELRENFPRDPEEAAEVLFATWHCDMMAT